VNVNDKQKKILLVPIDDRPITYQFPQLIASVAGVSAAVAPRNLLGSRQGSVNTQALSHWLVDKLASRQPDAVAVCLDSLIYGGLVASRRSDDSENVVLERIKNIGEWKHINDKSPAVYAQSSIMRISNNYYNNEEKSYWSQYGREIFKWSQLLHQQERSFLKDQSELKEVEAKIDPEVRKDYLATRERNFHVNLKLIEYVQAKAIDFLIFSQDDTGELGLNVLEKEKLLASCNGQRLTNVMAYCGTDEVLMTLLARWLGLNSDRRPRISLHYSPHEGRAVLSNYEGKTIEETIRAQAKAAALDVAEMTGDLGDLAVIVHTGGHVQGDHMWLSGHPDLRALKTDAIVENTMQLLEQMHVPTIICDVAYSNGSDPALMTRLMGRKDLVNKLWGYAGWNTTGNTVGSTLALGVARWYANQNVVDTADAFRQAMFVRFADDWVYQTQVRPQLSGEPSEELLNQLMMPLVRQLFTLFDFEPKNIKFKFPWQRTFEVEVCVET
jgi:hypothetical protein